MFRLLSERRRKLKAGVKSRKKKRFCFRSLLDLVRWCRRLPAFIDPLPSTSCCIYDGWCSSSLIQAGLQNVKGSRLQRRRHTRILQAWQRHHSMHLQPGDPSWKHPSQPAAHPCSSCMRTWCLTDFPNMPCWLAPNWDPVWRLMHPEELQSFASSDRSFPYLENTAKILQSQQAHWHSCWAAQLGAERYKYSKPLLMGILLWWCSFQGTICFVS